MARNDTGARVTSRAAAIAKRPPDRPNATCDPTFAATLRRG